MRKLITFLAFLAAIPAFGHGVVIDHTNVDYTVIPDAYITAAKAKTSVFRHSSVEIEIQNGLNNIQAISAGNATKYSHASWLWSSRGNLGGWTAKLADLFTQEMACGGCGGGYYDNHPPPLVVYTWGWGAPDAYSTASTPHAIQWTTVRDTILAWKATHPGVTLVWNSLSNDDINAHNANYVAAHVAFQASIRSFFTTSDSDGMFLYDFGDIEAYAPDGTHCIHNVGGLDIEYVCPVYGDQHPNLPAGQAVLSGSWWWLMARIAGWDGSFTPPVEPTPTTPTIQPVTNNLGSSQTVNWTINDTNAQYYNIYQCVGAVDCGAGTYADYTVQTAGLNSINVSPLIPNTLYGYKVSAVNNNAVVPESALSSAATATTLNIVEPLIIHYKFDTGQALTTLFDDTTNSVDGSLFGRVTESMDHIDGTASFNFNGNTADAYCSVGWKPVMNNFSANFSWGGWVKPYNATGSTIVVADYNGVFRVDVQRTSENYPHAVITTGGVAHQLRGFAALSLYRWHYLALIYDGSAARFYVDGAMVDSTAATGVVAFSDQNRIYVGTGDPNEEETPFLEGRLDDMRFLNDAVTLIPRDQWISLGPHYVSGMRK